MDAYDSDEDKSQYQKLWENRDKIKPGMFVSAWDDSNDLVEENPNIEGNLEDRILWAAKEGKIDIVREVLNIDSNCVNAKDSDGYTPLHRAAYNNFVDIAELLLQHKANPNALTELQWTPLHSASKWSNAEIAALLLQYGADINAPSDGYQTPLHIAASVSNCRNTASVLLLNPNVNAYALNNSDETATDIARRTGRTFPIFEMGHNAYQVETGLID